MGNLTATSITCDLHFAIRNESAISEDCEWECPATSFLENMQAFYFTSVKSDHGHVERPPACLLAIAKSATWQECTNRTRLCLSGLEGHLFRSVSRSLREQAHMASAKDGMDFSLAKK